MVDSGRASVLSALQATAASRVAVVDLSEAGGWWPTRLFALCAGAARQGGPGTITFVSGRDRHDFVGYASSAALRDAFLAARDDYRAAYKRAARISAKLSLVPPTPVGGLPPPMPSTDPELTADILDANIRRWMVDLPKQFRFEISGPWVLAYEEPVLRAKFGPDYDDYCRRIPRWIPSLRSPPATSRAWPEG